MSSLRPSRLKRRLRILHQLHRIIIPPKPRPRRTLPINQRPTRTIRLSPRLRPNDTINQRTVRLCRRSDAKASLRIAPLSPLGPRVLQTAAALIDDEVCGQGIVGQVWCERLRVVEFVEGFTPFRVGCAWVGDVGVEVRDVGGEAADFGAGCHVLGEGDDFGKFGGSCWRSVIVDCTMGEKLIRTLWKIVIPS